MKKKDVLRLRYLWAKHDMLERKILLLERKFTDKELKKLGAAAGAD